MIPVNRPVIGYDLEDLREKLGVPVVDACWLFGMSVPKWTRVTRKLANEAVTDAGLALLVRFLDRHPDAYPIPRAPSPDEVFGDINKIRETDMKELGLMMGREASSGYRWLKTRGHTSAVLNRLLYLFREMLFSGRSNKDRTVEVESWREMVSVESKARGVADIWRTGQWTTPAARQASRAAKIAEKEEKAGESKKVAKKVVGKPARAAGKKKKTV